MRAVQTIHIVELGRLMWRAARAPSLNQPRMHIRLPQPSLVTVSTQTLQLGASNGFWTALTVELLLWLIRTQIWQTALSAQLQYRNRGTRLRLRSISHGRGETLSTTTVGQPGCSFLVRSIAGWATSTGFGPLVIKVRTRCGLPRV